MVVRERFSCVEAYLEIKKSLQFLLPAGIPKSHCYGSVIQGIFQGTIHLPEETYHIEKSKRFFKDSPAFHSVIYRESDLNIDPFRERRERERRERREASTAGSCGYEYAKDSMRKSRNSPVEENNKVGRVRAWVKVFRIVPE